jgi:hypothetical protein
MGMMTQVISFEYLTLTKVSHSTAQALTSQKQSFQLVPRSGRKRKALKMYYHKPITMLALDKP